MKNSMRRICRSQHEKKIVMRKKNALKLERDIQNIKHAIYIHQELLNIASHRSNWEANKPHAK